jgi:hypothetical protein
MPSYQKQRTKPFPMLLNYVKNRGRIDATKHPVHFLISLKIKQGRILAVNSLF